MHKQNILGNETEHLIEEHPSLVDTLSGSLKGRCKTLSNSQVKYYIFTDNSVEATK